MNTDVFRAVLRKKVETGKQTLRVTFVRHRCPECSSNICKMKSGKQCAHFSVLFHPAIICAEQFVLKENFPKKAILAHLKKKKKK